MIEGKGINAILEKVAQLEQEEKEAQLSTLFKNIAKDENLGKAIDEIFAETNDLNEIQTKVILVIKGHLRKKRGNNPDDPKLIEEEKQIEKDIFEISNKFMEDLLEEIDQNLGTVSKKDKANNLNAEAKKSVKRVMKNFAVYQIYKVMNPRRIAGETAKDNYRNNLIYGGKDLANQYEGGKESDLRKYGAAEVARIKSQVKAFKKSGGNIER